MISQTDKWVQFAFSHQTLIIEGIFAVILAIIVIWLFTNLNQENEKKSIHHTQGGINPDLEAALKKLVANQNGLAGASTVTQGAPTPANAPKPSSPTTPPVAIFGGSPAPTIFSTPSQNAPGAAAVTPSASKVAATPSAKPVTEPMQPAPKAAPEVITASVEPVIKTPKATNSQDGDLQKAHEEIDSQKKRINDLLASLDQTRLDLKTAKDELAKGGDAEELRKRIAVLEARLQEYEVIEDDIANLSAYKKENEQLKKELYELRNAKGGPSPSPSWPLNNDQPPRPLKPIDTKKPEVMAEEAGAKEGEKLLLEFQKFMKGSSNG